MKEDFLHYIWKFKNFNASSLQTVDGSALSIQNVGLHNLDQGPDFSVAKISIDDKVWVGNVEIHIKSSDWFKHKHQNDKNYNNVILHVVWEHDKDVVVSGNVLPTLELKGLVSKNVLDKWEKLNAEITFLPCVSFLKKIPNVILNNWLERMLIERLEEKMLMISEGFSEKFLAPSELFFMAIAKAFGQHKNAFGFEQVGAYIRLSILQRHKYSLFEVEALLFGVAGLLEGVMQDEYAQQLQNEFIHLKKRYSLATVPKEVWKYLRLRPASFPDVRIAQLAALICSEEDLFSVINEEISLEKCIEVMSVSASAYWDTHYRLGVKSEKEQEKKIGKNMIESVVVNAVLPFYVFQLKQVGIENDRFIESVGESLKPEQNSIIQTMVDSGFSNKSILNSQALLQLNTGYCLPKKCLSCSIGIAALKQG
jgi:hypothetical protein